MHQLLEVWAGNMQKQIENQVKEMQMFSGGQSLNRPFLSNIRSLLDGGKTKTKFLYDQAVKHNAAVVVVTETWLKPKVLDSEITVNFPGYTILRSDRKKQGWRGCLCFSKGRFEWRNPCQV